MMKKTKNNPAGFSFVEAMLSVAVVSIGIIGIFPLLNSGLREAFDSRDQVIAAMLAQEGTEMVQNFRDNNWAEGKGAFEGNAFPNADNPNCRVNYNDDNDDKINCDSGNGHKKLYLNGNSFYIHSAAGGAAETKFQRKIIFVYDTGLSATAKTLSVTSAAIWGSDFPGGAIDDSSCNTASKCVFAKVTLSKWDE